MKYIKKVAVSPIPEINGSVVDTFNVEDKTTNAPSINLIQGKILWQNSNPTSSFAEQDIILNSDDFDTLKFIYKSQASDNEVLTSECLKGSRPKLIQSYCGTNGIVARDRDVQFKNNTTYFINSGRYCATGSTGRVVDNNLIIPLYVIGYKTGLFN